MDPSVIHSRFRQNLNVIDTHLAEGGIANYGKALKKGAALSFNSLRNAGECGWHAATLVPSDLYNRNIEHSYSHMKLSCNYFWQFLQVASAFLNPKLVVPTLIMVSKGNSLSSIAPVKEPSKTAKVVTSIARAVVLTGISCAIWSFLKHNNIHRIQPDSSISPSPSPTPIPSKNLPLGPTCSYEVAMGVAALASILAIGEYIG